MPAQHPLYGKRAKTQSYKAKKSSEWSTLVNAHKNEWNNGKGKTKDFDLV